MRRTRSWMALLLVLTLGVAATACGDDDDDSGSTDTTAASSDTTAAAGGETAATLDGVTLVSDGELTVCTDSPYPPFEFEGDDGEQTGFDMELLRVLIAPLDLELAPTVTPFDGIWLQPAAGTCDLVGSAMTITPERQAAALFSDPYFDADQSLLVRVDDQDTYATLDSLAGAVIAVQTGTTGEAYAQENAPEGAEVKSFDEAAAMFLALESGDVAAILQDFPVNAYRATQDDQFVVTETFTTGEQYGFGASLDNTALIDVINTRLAEVRDSGEYDEVFSEWFGEAPQ
ncbi:MAG: transporter substrate-binding domain-containing protein [Acidimicrobiales bacterium]|nr:transporter substrate-binding domain-containing protein [Acidimicrobiales bacterium]